MGQGGDSRGQGERQLSSATKSQLLGQQQQPLSSSSPSQPQRHPYSSSGLPSPIDGRYTSSAGGGGLRTTHGDFAAAQSFAGVGQGSNIAVHDANVAGIAPSNQPNGGRDNHVDSSRGGGGAHSQANMLTNSSGAIEGNRRPEARAATSGMGNGEMHPAERKTFGQKLADFLSCRCGS